MEPLVWWEWVWWWELVWLWVWVWVFATSVEAQAVSPGWWSSSLLFRVLKLWSLLLSPPQVCRRHPPL